MDLAKTQQGIEKDKALKAADILSQILQQDKSQAKMQ
jgi:hypothetical protein